MTEDDKISFAQETIQLLVKRVLDKNIIEKSITYKTLAEKFKIDAHRQVPIVLGVTGNWIQNLDTIDGERIPVLNCLIKNQSSGLPGNGLDGFLPFYRNLSDEKKKDYVNAEIEKIKTFGLKWLKVLDLLKIEHDFISEDILKQYEQSQQTNEIEQNNRRVREYIKKTHHLLGYNGTSEPIEDYLLSSGDTIDVIFFDNDRIYAYVAKPSNTDESEKTKGIFQCVKNAALLAAEETIKEAGKFRTPICALITETDLTQEQNNILTKLGIKHYLINSTI